ncbi:polyphosphate kinase 1 [Thiolinea disciformis]|uniref:polyphosphate kinase 1 n=1 Tax=Thiolinea disciformis TaxID=125614 RepID=UPI00037CECCB
MNAPINGYYPEHFINRELSLLAFNERVLDLAQDDKVPLLERLRYLCISSANLDEFFEVRVGRLKQQVALNLQANAANGLSNQALAKALVANTHDLVRRQYGLLNEVLIPALKREDIHFLRRTKWNDAQRAWLADYFERELLPLLNPLGLDPAHPFPNVLNKSLNFLVELCGTDAFGRELDTAIVQAPRILPRIIRMPEAIAPSKDSFVFLSSILHAFIDRLFPSMTVKGCHQFRLTRNSEMYVDEEEVDDLLKAMKGELSHRNYGQAVRLEVADRCPVDSVLFLCEQFGLSQADVYQVNGPVNLNRLMTVLDLVERPDLRFPPFRQNQVLGECKDRPDSFSQMRCGDILLHQPYQSFQPVLDFVDQAARDPDVLAIKITLYRTGRDSALVESLARAARAGKEVIAVVELRARFDEAANIDLTNRLQQANAHVVYGVVGYKTHAKACLVVRREKGGLVRYVHLSTGNYHAGTARAYTDFALLTCNPAITEDVHRIFHLLTGLGRMPALNHLLVAPFTLHQAMLDKIEREIEHAKAGTVAHIMAKMNALIEPQIIEALYRASNAGVQIDLIVRGVCCLRPNLAGVSENIRVRSVMGRFLEHPRVYYFLNAGAEEMYCASADWMPRNFFRRVELAFPILDPSLRERVKREAFEWYLTDNSQAWVLDAEGQYTRLQPSSDQKNFSAQTHLLCTLSQ